MAFFRSKRYRGTALPSCGVLADRLKSARYAYVSWRTRNVAGQVAALAVAGVPVSELGSSEEGLTEAELLEFDALRAALQDASEPKPESVVAGRLGFYTCRQPVSFGTREEPLVRPCRTCIGCRRSAANIFRGALQSEASVHVGRLSFVTLTYNRQSLPDLVAGCSADLTNFLKRLRITLKRRFDVSGLRYAAVLERGTEGTKRFHWHVIFFGVSTHLLRDVVESCWKNGFVNVKRFAAAHISYLAKYISKGGALDVMKSKGLGYAPVFAACEPFIERLKFARIEEVSPDGIVVPSSFNVSGSRFRMTPYLRSRVADFCEDRGYVFHVLPGRSLARILVESRNLNFVVSCWGPLSLVMIVWT